MKIENGVPNHCANDTHLNSSKEKVTNSQIFQLFQILFFDLFQIYFNHQNSHFSDLFWSILNSRSEQRKRCSNLSMTDDYMANTQYVWYGVWCKSNKYSPFLQYKPLPTNPGLQIQSIMLFLVYPHVAFTWQPPWLVLQFA